MGDYDSWKEHNPRDDKRVCEDCGVELVELEDEGGMYYEPHDCERFDPDIPDMKAMLAKVKEQHIAMGKALGFDKPYDPMTELQRAIGLMQGKSLPPW